MTALSVLCFLIERAVYANDFSPSALMHVPQAVVALYISSLGWIMVFLFLASLLGAIGSGCRRILSPAPARLVAFLRLLQSRNVAIVLASVALLLVHMGKFAVPPKLRPITLTGKLTTVVSRTYENILVLYGVVWPIVSPQYQLNDTLVVLFIDSVSCYSNY